MDEIYPQTAVLVRLAVERVGADPEDEQRYLELNFALDRAVERDLRYRELLALFAEGAMSAAPAVSWAWRLAAGLGANLMGDSAAAVRWLLEAEAEITELGRLNTPAGAFVFSELARAHYHAGDHNAGLEAATRSLQLARSANSAQAEAYARHYLGLISLRRRDFDYARRHITGARDLFEWMNQRHGRARVLDSLAILLMEQSQYGQALELLQESLVVKEELRDLRGQALTCGNLARLHMSLGDYPQARHYLDRELELVSRVGDERNSTVVRLRLGQLHLGHGNFAQAQEALQAARELAVSRRDARLEAHACFRLSEAEWHLGRFEQSLEAIGRAWHYFSDRDDAVMRDRAAIRQALMQGLELESPEIQEPLNRLRQSDAHAALAEALFETASFFRNRGKPIKVITLYTEALDVAEPALADQLAAIMRSRADSAEGRAWVDAMLMVKQQKDQLEAAYAELRRAQTLRDSLTQMIVHDLKNPLTVVVPWLELIQAGDCSPEEIREYLQTALDECGYLLRMIDDLNDVGKMQLEGTLELTPAPVAVGDMIVDVARRMQGRARESRMTIRVAELAPDSTVLADAGKLRRVLENLVANGIKYGRPPEDRDAPAEVVLASYFEPPSPGYEHGSVRVEVRDHGEGIPLREAERVFEPYYQAEAGRKRKAGVGLGLAFCRMVVEASGGTIWTQPSEDGGSVFAFRLPAPGKEASGQSGRFDCPNPGLP